MSLNEAAKDLRKGLFDEGRDHVTIKSVAVAHSEQPEPLYFSQVFYTYEGILVRFRMAGDKPLPLLDSIGLHDVMLECNFWIHFLLWLVLGRNKHPLVVG